MRETLKLLVTSTEVGLIVDVTEEDAKAVVAKARDVLKRLLDSSAPLHAPRTERKKTARSLSARILNLGAGFFAEPKESVDISKELARASFYYEPVRVRDELRRLVARGQLRRLGDGTRANPFKYVNR